MHGEPLSPNSRAGVFRIYDETESPNDEGMFKMYDEPDSPNEGAACLRFLANRNRHDEPGSPNEGVCLISKINWNCQTNGHF